MVRTEVIEWLKSIKEKYIHGGDDFYDHQRRTAIDYAVCFLEGKKPMTNADRIRAMSDEELAEFIMLSPEMEFSVCECCEVFRGHGAYTPCETEDGWCRAELRCNAFKKWLQQPAEEV